jgi:hypothetical protein
VGLGHVGAVVDPHLALLDVGRDDVGDGRSMDADLELVEVWIVLVDGRLGGLVGVGIGIATLRARIGKRCAGFLPPALA